MDLYISAVIAFASIVQISLAMNELTFQLVEDFYRSRHVNHIVLFECSGYGKEILKKFTARRFQAALLNVADLPGGFQNISSNLEHLLGIVLDVSCDEYDSFFKQVSDRRWFMEDIIWLLIPGANMALPRDDKALQTARTFSVPSEVPALLDSEVWLAIPSEDNVSLVEAYKPAHDHPFVYQASSIWVQGQLLGPELPKYRRRNCHEIELIVATLGRERNPNFETQAANEILRQYFSVEQFLPMYLGDMFNFSIKHVTETIEGDSLDGKWGGLIGLLANGEADLAAFPLFPHPVTASVVDFLFPTSWYRSGFVFMQPPISAIKNVYVVPFSRSVWLCSASALVLVAILLVITLFLEDRFSKEEKHGSLWCRIQDVTLLTLGAMCQQGSETEPRTISARVIFLFLFILSVLLYTAYSTAVVSLISATGDSVTSVDELITSPFKAAITESPEHRVYFETTNDQWALQIRNKKVQSPAYVNLSEGLDQVKKKLLALYANIDEFYLVSNEKYSVEEMCSLAELFLSQELKQAAMAVVRASPYRQFFNYGLLKIRESGILSFERSHHLVERPRCLKHEGFISLGLQEFLPAVHVLAWGIGASILGFIMETIINKRISRKARDVDLQNDKRRKTVDQFLARQMAASKAPFQYLE